MVTLDCSASRHDGVTLVTARLRDIDGPTRVRVENRLDGPVWPPRSEGVPEAGWSDDGFDGVVGPGTAALGYASPASPADPPAALVDATPASDAEPDGMRAEDPDAVVRELGDPSPPADAVPRTVPETPDRRRARPNERATETEREWAAKARRERTNGTDANRTPAPGGSERATLRESETPPAEVPDALGPWLAEMARRVDHAESLAAAETLPEAATAVRETGGLARVRELEDDERRLRVVERRVRRLAERRAAADVPVETLAALA